MVNQQHKKVNQTLHLVSCALFLVPCSLYLVPCLLCLVPCAFICCLFTMNCRSLTAAFLNSFYQLFLYKNYRLHNICAADIAQRKREKEGYIAQSLSLFFPLREK